MKEAIRLGRYRHFKGNEYELIHVAKDSECPDSLWAVYRGVTSGEVWVRPLDMFLQSITKDGKTFPRFEYIGK